MDAGTATAQEHRYFRPRRLGHVNLWVDDLKISERFYSEVCGLNVEFTEPDLIATFLGTGHTPHDLGMIQKTNGVDRYGRDGLLQLPGTIGLHAGLNHLAWELDNEADLVKAYRHLKQDEIETDITVDHQVAHSVYMFDPDGNYNEFYCDTVKDWRNVLNGPMELLTSHWDPLTAEGFTEGRYERNPVLRTVEGAAVHPWRLTHATLQTADVARLVDFYTSVGGLHVVARDNDVVYLGAALSEYDYNLVLVPHETAAYHHASFQLKDEAALADAKAALARAGVEIIREADLPWKQSIYLRDPDGMLSEWYVARRDTRDLAQCGDVPLAFAV
ncbi:MAG TPA: dioxygenase [Pusillimonas sp.]|jgi:catechol 2,3-dioxygenase|nr:dioxygenase [Pusillimonas sp.]|tara:strand:+ start:59340 stop:60332 length:993 start_codon:yes stop_codon:yes gene_type:complete